MIARIAEAALSACTKSDKDTFCANYCRQLWPEDASDENARCSQLAKSRQWMRSLFGSDEEGAEWNTPKKFRSDTPTALSGKKEGCKRKAEFEGVASTATKYHVKALTYH